VSWDPNNGWTASTVVGGPTYIPERLTNSLGDAIPGTGSPTLTEVWLATNGGGPYTRAPGNPFAAPTGVLETNYGASHLNRDRVLVGSAFIGPPYTGHWYAFYWPLVNDRWPEARALPGPSWMTGSFAGAINDFGLVVGDASEATRNGQKVHARAWRLRGSGADMTADTLPDLPWVTGAEVMEGTAVNNEGVISGYLHEAGQRGRYLPAAWLPAARFDYRYTTAPRVLPLEIDSYQNLAVNACGWVVLKANRSVKRVGSVSYGVVWNVWTNAQLELPAPSGFDNTAPYDIADNGDVVGYAAVSGSLATTRRAVLWKGYIPACTP
jgi:hypothetical protein